MSAVTDQVGQRQACDSSQPGLHHVAAADQAKTVTLSATEGRERMIRVAPAAISMIPHGFLPQSSNHRAQNTEHYLTGNLTKATRNFQVMRFDFG